MPFVRSSRGTRRGSAGASRTYGRRRRTSIATRARFRRGAYAQSRQITALARLATRNASILRGQRLYSDYFLQGAADTTWIANTWYVASLVDPISWKPTLRQNEDADKAQNAYVRNMFFQYTCGLNSLKQSGTVTLMLVSIRGNAADFEPSNTSMGNGEEYQNLGPYQMPIVNSGLMVVKWSKTFVVQSNGLGGKSVDQSTMATGDPTDTFARGSANVHIGNSLRSPSRFIAPGTSPQSWSTLADKDLRPRERLYLLGWYQSQDATNCAGLTWSCKFTVLTTN